jgi:gamma-butyrobetaine dioxygenase
MPDPTLDDLLDLYRGELANEMYDEVVTEREHALQAAQLAEESGADDATVAAALLHDVGRLLIDWDTPEGLASAAGSGNRFVAADRAHDRVGERYLTGLFGPEVTAPVGMHVAAKRYLCATDPDYLAILSSVSVRSLEVQGGPMSAEEVAAFEQRPGWKAGVQLRRWDDQAKLVDAKTKQVDDHRPLLERLVRQ